jgi:hypothetical protein
MIQEEINKHGIELNLREKGRKVATTFKGFYGFHDKATFQPIEDFEYEASLKQNFLFSYRSFAFEYHKKMEAFKNLRKIVKDKPSLLKGKQF